MATRKAWRRSRPFCVSHFFVFVQADEQGKTDRHGACYQQDRPDPDFGADSESSRVPPQRDPEPGAQRGVREILMRIFAVALLACAFVVSAVAGEEPAQLKKSPGLDKVESNCGGCHSLDYVVM